MAWLAGGVLYSMAYLAAGSILRGNAQALLWLRISALLVPPMTGILVIAWRRRDWSGCQWLFWATIALGSWDGLSMNCCSPAKRPGSDGTRYLRSSGPWRRCLPCSPSPTGG
jgi:hypothetical protein